MALSNGYKFQTIDQIQNALQYLITQFKDKPVIVGFLTQVANYANLLENLLQQMTTQRSVYTAIGTQLDQIGKIVGVDRSGLSDADYRNQIFFQIGVNSSRSNPESIIQIVKFITNSTYVKYDEEYPASVRIFVNGKDNIGDNITNLKKIAPLGVDVQIEYINQGSFGFDPPNSIVLGYGDVAHGNYDPAAGGWATVDKLS